MLTFHERTKGVVFAVVDNHGFQLGRVLLAGKQDWAFMASATPSPLSYSELLEITAFIGKLLRGV